MKVCCIVLQERYEAVASGVVSLIMAFISNWPPQDSKRLMVLCNKGHWAYEEFYKLKMNGKIGFLITSPFFTVSYKIAQINNSIKHLRMMKLLTRIIYILQPFFYLWAILKLSRLFIDYKVGVVFSHNGGYPGGALNRIAVIADY